MMGLKGAPMTHTLALALVASLTAATALAADPRIASTDINEVCASDGKPGSAYSRTHRVVRRQHAPGMVADHRIPLCLGGSDADVNIQMQPPDEAHEKDRLEGLACRMVCRGAVPLDVAQGWFLGDWRAAGAGR